MRNLDTLINSESIFRGLQPSVSFRVLQTDKYVLGYIGTSDSDLTITSTDGTVKSTCWVLTVPIRLE